MLLRTLEAPLLGATCTVVVDGRGRAAVVDPGAGVAGAVVDLVEREGWTPVAVLATHGHVDHTWDAGLLCEQWSVPMHLHEADAYRLADPFGTLGQLGSQLRAMAGRPDPLDPPHVLTHAVPALVTEPMEIGLDLPLEALHLPGHTEGSTAYLLDQEGTPVLLTGDVLFAGTVGRTDLPGGDHRAMARSLALLARQDPSTVVIPGHGPRSTIGGELRSNPYLRAAR